MYAYGGGSQAHPLQTSWDSRQKHKPRANAGRLHTLEGSSGHDGGGGGGASSVMGFEGVGGGSLSGGAAERTGRSLFASYGGGGAQQYRSQMDANQQKSGGAGGGGDEMQMPLRVPPINRSGMPSLQAVGGGGGMNQLAVSVGGTSMSPRGSQQQGTLGGGGGGGSLSLQSRDVLGAAGGSMLAGISGQRRNRNSNRQNGNNRGRRQKHGLLDTLNNTGLETSSMYQSMNAAAAQAHSLGSSVATSSSAGGGNGSELPQLPALGGGVNGANQQLMRRNQPPPQHMQHQQHIQQQPQQQQQQQQQQQLMSSQQHSGGGANNSSYAAPSVPRESLPMYREEHMFAAVTSIKGLKPGNPSWINQDNFFVIEKFDNRDINFYCVLDGHGENGHHVSRRCREAFPQHIRSSNLDMKRAFNIMQNDLNSCEFDVRCSGATCVLASLCGGRLSVSNCGDSRAVLGRRNPNGSVTAHALTQDHKPDKPEERKRILACGGHLGCRQVLVNQAGRGPISMPVGPCRVWYQNRGETLGLAMSRSLGDTIVHRSGVSAEPETLEHIVDEYDEFMIIATDGVWDVIDNNQAVQMVQNFVAKSSNWNATEASNTICKFARSRWEKLSPMVDDITAIVVKLQRK